MTLGECFGKILKLLNYYSAGGVPIGADSAKSDLLARAASLIDTAQIQVSAVWPVERSVSIACTPVKNRIRAAGPWRAAGEGLVFTLPDGDAASLSLRTQDALHVEVLQGENTLAAFDTEDAADLRAYTAAWTPGEGALILRITGTGRVADPALYRETFADADSVPVFGPFRDHPLPADFRRLISLTLHPWAGPVQRDCRDYRLKPGVIALPWGFDGEAALTYAAWPAPVTEETGEDEVLTVDDAAAQAVAVYAAAGLAAGEDPALEKRLLAMYRGLLSDVEPARSVDRIRPALYAAPRRRFV